MSGFMSNTIYVKNMWVGQLDDPLIQNKTISIAQWSLVLNKPVNSEPIIYL